MKINSVSRARVASIATALFFSCAIAVYGQQQADNTYIAAATVWQQASGEARALEWQTYVLARMLLDRDLRNHRIRMRRAIIVDVDETIPDNSHYQGILITKWLTYPEGWTAWGK